MVVTLLPFLWAVLTYIPTSTHAHGRLLNPPSRMSAWRFGFPVPKNYDDNQQYCGGFVNQWARNQGKCGICGDPWQGPRYYERPNGKYVKGPLVITSQYRQGEVIEVDVEVTANHKGYFEFRVCDVRQSGGVEATHECLDRNLLADRTGKTRFYIGTRKGVIKFRLVLPPSLTCQQCVFQWKWHCGNNWGDAQEEFYACSDVSITARGAPIPTQRPFPVTRYPTVPPTPVTMPPLTPVTGYPWLTEPITNPPRRTLPPNVLNILGDNSRPLKSRIWYYVQYQKSVHNGYTVWAANKIDFKSRGDSQLGSGRASINTWNPRTKTKDNNNNNNNQSNDTFCQACRRGCVYSGCRTLCPNVICSNQIYHYSN